MHARNVARKMPFEQNVLYKFLTLSYFNINDLILLYWNLRQRQFVSEKKNEVV